MKNLDQRDLDRFKADDGNKDPSDPVKLNQEKRKAYFKAKKDFEKGLVSRAEMETRKNAIGRRLLAGWSAPPERAAPGGGPDGTSAKTDPETGEALDADDLALTDESDGQPLDDDVMEFKDFRGVCKPCTKGCGGGCAEGWFYREKKCVEACNMTGEVAKTLGSFQVCVCPEGTFRNKTTQNCDACAQGCGKCQTKDKCDQCGASQFLSINPVNKKRECVSACPEGFAPIPWKNMDKGVKEIFTKSKKVRNEEKAKKEGKKFRVLATTNTTNGTFGNQTDKNGNYVPSAKELEFEKNMTNRDVMAEVEEFKAVEFAGMCAPCKKNCKACAPGMFLKGDGSCAKGCDGDTEETIIDPTTKKGSCRVDTNPRLKIVWGSKKDEKDLMDDSKVEARKEARKAAISSGDDDADLLDASVLGGSVEEEAEELNSGLQDPMEDLVLRATWNQQMTGNFEWEWTVRQGVDNVEEFLRGINVNKDTLKIPSANLAEVDLKAITIACKARQGDQRYETEF